MFFDFRGGEVIFLLVNNWSFLYNIFQAIIHRRLPDIHFAMITKYLRRADALNFVAATDEATVGVANCHFFTDTKKYLYVVLLARAEGDENTVRHKFAMLR